MKQASRFWPTALGLYGAIGGAVSLAGWALNLPRLTDVFGTGIAIQPNTTVATMATGVALMCLAAGRIRETRVLAVFAALIGFTALFETTSGITLGHLDTFLRFGREWGNNSVVSPGRMGAPSATSWMLIGYALLMATSTKLSARVRCTGPAAAGVATVIASTSLIGYFFGASALYSIPSATAIAIQTATFVLALSLGTILSVPQFGPGRLIYDDTMAGAMFRRMLPALVMVPLVLGFLRLEGERRGLYDLAFGTTARTVAEMAILTFFVWLAALDMSKIERERRLFEDALQKSRAELELGARRKDEFLMTLAHELRNPLAPIRTAVDLMNRTSPGEDLSRPREVIDRQLKLMVRLLDDLLDVGRIERDSLTLRKARVDLFTVIRNAVEISQPLADRFKQQIVVHSPARPIEVDADSARLEQVIANLLNNACRFTPADGRIEVWLEREGHDGAGDDVAIVRVRDNGIGIPPEDLSRVFNMFEQLDGSRERAQGGLGIGLHLVKRLVEMHGGTVEARSLGISHGSEFVVRLPALLTAAQTSSFANATADNNSDAAKPLVSARRILVVDDNVDAAVALSMLLNMIGHETHIAHDGPQALEAVTTVQPDVVLLDLGLPGMSGFDVCRHIRMSVTDKPPLVVALTGWGQESDRQKSRDSGFDHHLVKPVDYDALAALLANPVR